MTDELEHRSLRIPRPLADRVRGLQQEGETLTAAYIRIISAGVEAVASGGEGAAGAARQATGAAGDGLIESLRDHIQTAKEEISRLSEQLDTKDEQIEARDRQIEALTGLADRAQELTAQAHALHALEGGKAEEIVHDEPEHGGGRRGLWSRLWGR